MEISELFSKDKFPQLRNYTLLIAALIAGGGVISGGFGKNDDEYAGTSDNPAKSSLVWVHSTQVFWEESPVEVNKGDKVPIYASGSYYDSVDDLIGGEHKADVLSASGIRNVPHTRAAMNLLVSGHSKYGQLLVQIVPDGAHPKLKPEPNDFRELENGKNDFSANHGGTLWFTTNHPSFSPYDQQMLATYNELFGDSVTVFQHDNKPEPNYRDNFGHLTLQIDVVKK